MNKTPIVWKDIDSLQQWQHNPNDGDVGAIMQGIKEFGYNKAVAFWNEVIKDGNHRVKALALLKKDGWHPDDCKNPSQFLVTNGKGWSVACYDISHMPEVEANAFALSLNRTSRRGYDDPTMLLDVLTNIKNDASDILDATGYNLEDMGYLFDIQDKQRAIKLPVSTGRMFGDAKKQIKPVLYVEEIATFEKALKLTKEKNRGVALLKICAEYIESHD